MSRLEGWEARLNTVIEAARDTPYVLGQHDCLRVACATVQALTGVDHWPGFAGYTTRREALRVILMHGKDLGDAVTRTLGVDPVEPGFARRGDLVMYADDADDDQHLGVCVGQWVAVLGEQGLQLVSLLDGGVQGAWRIG